MPHSHIQSLQYGILFGSSQCGEVAEAGPTPSASVSHYGLYSTCRASR